MGVHKHIHKHRSKYWFATLGFIAIFFTFNFNLFSFGEEDSGRNIVLFGPSDIITLNSSETYQMITGWEVVNYAMQENESFVNFSQEVINRTVNEMGINRIRLEIRSGEENSKDLWNYYRNGTINYTNWRAVRYATVNDNNDPNVINWSGFWFSGFNENIVKVVKPMKNLVEANGEKFYVNLNYVAFTSQIVNGSYIHDDADEYAEFILATFLWMNQTHGFIPDAVEIVLEPGNVAQWNGTYVGEALVKTGDKLSANGFNPDFIAPSDYWVGGSVNHFDKMILVPNVTKYLTEFAYHRYGWSDQDIQNVVSRAATYGLNTSMLEWWTSGNNYYDGLLKDLKLGMNSAWQSWSLVGDGGYNVDLTNPFSPVVTINNKAKYFRQYFKEVRSGAVRIEATPSNSNYDPIAFINKNGNYVVVVRALTSGNFTVKNLPSGTYNTFYTVWNEYDTKVNNITVNQSGELIAYIPDNGVITIYQTVQVSNGSGGGSGSTENCNNGIDDDNNNATDWEDNKCYSGGKTYYVSESTGNDAWDGLEPEWNGTSGPIKTLNASDNIVHRATGIMNGGDHILFKRGDYWKENFTTAIFKISHKGTEDNRTIIGAYGKGNRPVFDIGFSGNIFDISSSNNGTKRTEWLIIKDIKLTSTAQNSTRPAGIALYEADENEYPRNVIFQNLEFKDLRQALGIQGVINFTIKNSLLEHNYKRPPLTGYSSGFYTSHIYGLHIINNTFDTNGKQHDSGDHQNYLSGSHNVYIENNTYLHSNSGVKLRVGTNYTYRGNYCFNHSQCLMGGTDSLDINPNRTFRNFLIERNYFDSTGIAVALIAQSGGLSIINDVIIRNNLFLNQRSAPGEKGYLKVAANSEHHNISIYNNLFYNITGNQGIYLNYNSDDLNKTDFEIKNNIFYIINNTNNAPRILIFDLPTKIGTEILLENNLYYNDHGKIIFEINGTDYYDLTELRNNYSNLEINGQEGNPNIEDVNNKNYHLTTNSNLAVDKGINLTGIVDYDYDGNSRPYGIGWDIGPYEYYGNLTPTGHPTFSEFHPKERSAHKKGISTRFKLKAVDNQGINNCTLYINNVSNQTIIGSVGYDTHRFTVNNMPSGRHTYKISCINNGGNMTESTERTFYIIGMGNFTGNKTTNLSNEDIQAIRDFTIERENYGIVKFTETVDLTRDNTVDFEKYASLDRGYVIITSQNMTTFINRDAEITLLGLSHKKVKVLKDGIDCPTNECVIQSYSSGVIKFTVEGFSNYTIVNDTSTNTSNNGSGSGGGSGGGGGGGSGGGSGSGYIPTKTPEENNNENFGSAGNNDSESNNENLGSSSQEGEKEKAKKDNVITFGIIIMAVISLLIAGLIIMQVIRNRRIEESVNKIENNGYSETNSLG